MQIVSYTKNVLRSQKADLFKWLKLFLFKCPRLGFEVKKFVAPKFGIENDTGCASFYCEH